MGQIYTQAVTDEQRREFLRALGVGGAALAGGLASNVSLSELREVVSTDAGTETMFAEHGAAIQSGLTRPMDGKAVTSAMGSIAGALEQTVSGEVMASDVPGRDESVFGKLVDGGWMLDAHLSDVGLYASAEEALPRFSAGHIERMVRRLVYADSVSGLDAVGFGDNEQAALLSQVVTEADSIALWEPTWFLESVDFEEVNPAYVPPLQRRAVAGGLDWLSGLDKFLWQNEVLVTEAMLEAATRNARTILGGVYLVASAAEGIATGEIEPVELTATLAGGSAVAIAGQMALQRDVVRIPDDTRASPTRRAALNEGGFK